jgi:hypothetical protein
MALELAWLQKQVELYFPIEEKRVERFFLLKYLGSSKASQANICI